MPLVDVFSFFLIPLGEAHVIIESLNNKKKTLLCPTRLGKDIDDSQLREFDFADLGIPGKVTVIYWAFIWAYTWSIKKV